MSDLIKREELLDYLRTIPIDLGYREMEDVVTFVEKMKSVNAAEVVRCKDCKCWREGTAFSYCDKLYGMGGLDALDYMVAEDDYCSMAERRIDEQDSE